MLRSACEARRRAAAQPRMLPNRPSVPPGPQPCSSWISNGRQPTTDRQTDRHTGSVHACLPQTICLSTLMLIAQAVVLFRAWTDGVVLDWAGLPQTSSRPTNSVKALTENDEHAKISTNTTTKSSTTRCQQFWGFIRLIID